MPTIKVYDPSMQPALESCFKVCVEVLGREYQPDGRHLDIVNIEEVYMRCGGFWCLFQGNALVGMAAAPHEATMQMLETAKNLQDVLDTIPGMISELPDIAEEAI